MFLPQNNSYPLLALILGFLLCLELFGPEMPKKASVPPPGNTAYLVQH